MEFDFVKEEAVRQFYTYPKGYGEVMYVPKRSRVVTIRDWKGRRVVLPVPIMTLRSNDHNRKSTSRVWKDYPIS